MPRKTEAGRLDVQCERMEQLPQQHRRIPMDVIATTLAAAWMAFWWGVMYALLVMDSERDDDE